jgi:hypothetical protein
VGTAWVPRPEVKGRHEAKTVRLARVCADRPFRGLANRQSNEDAMTHKERNGKLGE